MAEFLALADILRPPMPPPNVSSAIPAAGTQPVENAHGTLQAAAVTDDDLSIAMRAARVFTARLADAFDAALQRMLRDLAAQVLMRELRSAPCDLAALAASVRATMPVTRVRCARADFAALCAAMPDAACAADDGLAPGDVIFEVSGGECDARLGTRLAMLLERQA